MPIIYTDTYAAEFLRESDQTKFQARIYLRSDVPQKVFGEILQIDSDGEPQPEIRFVQNGTTMESMNNVRKLILDHFKDKNTILIDERYTKSAPKPETDILEI